MYYDPFFEMQQKGSNEFNNLSTSKQDILNIVSVSCSVLDIETWSSLYPFVPTASDALFPPGTSSFETH